MLIFFKKNLKHDLERKRSEVLYHWLLQKVSAIFLLPLLCWFLFTLKDFVYRDYEGKILWFKNYANSVLLTLFLLVALFHLRLGLTIVIEDYIHNVKTKNFLLNSIAILCLILGVSTVLIVFKLSDVKNV